MAEEPSFTEAIHDALGSLQAFRLRVVHDPGSIVAPMKAGGQRTRDARREPRRLGQMIDEGLLSTDRDSEDIDLRDDARVGTNDRPATSFR